MPFKNFIILVFSISLFSGCKDVQTNETALENPQYLVRSMDLLSDVIVYDIFSPPQASRNYAYPSIAAYEVMSNADSSYQSLEGLIRSYTQGPTPPESYSPAVAAVQALLLTGKHFIFSEDKVEAFRMKILDEMKVQGVGRQDWEASLAYGEAVAKHVIQYSDGDNYKQIRTYPKYTVTDVPSEWQPTPPGYMDGIEPHWREIRPFVLDSAQQFIPAPPTKFDMEKGSQFYKETMEVYEAVNNGDDESKEIAAFWDCNPYKLNVTGHVMHATKKITPGGHWIGIVGIVSAKAKATWAKTIEAYTLTSIALADAFISCWDEKYRSNLVRPETVINEYIDESWVPFLQTPPFPEHTSGHSVISRAAAVALTSIFGDDFQFDDTTEVAYGLPIRSFDSFLAASDEAAVSRLYGGIHYRPAIDDGVRQGKKVGDHVVKRLQLAMDN